MVSFVIEQGEREALSPERAEELLAKLPTNAVDVKLSGKSFGDGSAAVAGEKLALASETLTKLDLSDIIASRPEDEAKRALSTIANALAVCRRLLHLDVSDNALGAKGVRALHELLVAQTSLESVKFCNNGLAGDACGLIAEALGPASETLRELHFHNNLSENAGALALAPLVERCALLQVFRFSSLRVGREGCVRMCQAVSGAMASGLRELNLSDNSFGAEGAAALAAALKSAPKLEVLNIRDCLLENEGVVKAINVLCDGAPGLKSIDVSGNECGKGAAKALAKLMCKAPLEKVLAEDNEFGSVGAVEISYALENCEKLVLLNLKCCEIGGRGAAAIAEVAQRCDGFRNNSVQLDGNSIPESVVEEITMMLGERLGPLDDNDEDGDEDEDEDEGTEEDED